MSLRFEKIAYDLQPVWQEIAYEPQTITCQDGHFVEVTPDIWFVLENGAWRTMTASERIDAQRQVYTNKFSIQDHSLPL